MRTKTAGPWSTAILAPLRAGPTAAFTMRPRRAAMTSRRLNVRALSTDRAMMEEATMPDPTPQSPPLTPEPDRSFRAEREELRRKLMEVCEAAEAAGWNGVTNS